ncbi:fasciclin domain-containing protein [Chitinophaga deserti]|uniref:fasciclin domain-containing protein n=1 Tax=Chitinophaga deserti TaxID=2164099 RepID=UPI000D6B7289|nr:fasciclin domain-containing protein [Chitinophaga deserti]
MKAILAGCLAFLAMVSSGCDKDKDDARLQDNNRIPQVLTDNFNLTVMNTVVLRTHMRNELKLSGPYTVFAPSDQAFQNAGFANGGAILGSSQAYIDGLANYHVVPGRYELNKMPFLFNQEIKSFSGKLFVTRWVKNNDTVLTVNGSRLLSSGIAASNGYVQVVDRVLEPYRHERISDAVAGEASLTLFQHALRTAGMAAMLDGAGPFTIYAPSNSAMQAYGFASIEAVDATDPETLRAILRYHIAADRRFVNDYILSAGTATSTTQGMINNNSVKVTLIPDPQQPGNFTGITLKGTGNTAEVKLSRRDIIAGNGVLHITDQVLRINQ